MAGTGLAHTGATGVVRERMEAMGGMADAMKVIVPMMRGEVPYEAEPVARSAENIAAMAGQGLVNKFPEGSLISPSEAAPAIWRDFDRFSELSLTLEDQAEALARAALSSNDLPTSEFAAMARTCGLCHERYRIETD